MKRAAALVPVLALAACGGGPAPAAPVVAPARADALARVESATAIVHELRGDADGSIPLAIARVARCVAVVPSLLHAGLLLGARAGRGVVTCRTQESWSKPSFFALSGATAGLSAGVQSVDLVMLVMTGDGEAAILKGKLQLGADTSVAAGPFGRTAQAAGEVTLGAAILYYSRSRGLFVGLDLSGTVLESDEEASRAFYGDARDFGALLHGDQAPPPSATSFLREMELAFPGGSEPKPAR